ncbi:MAG TPA: GntR family transcriptional regulator [Syntrophomonadaceae bacterium]|nr:GntR family transcriptional regulator [Syntrophomonadaceae bacterium]
MEIDSKSPIPIYVQLKEKLKYAIESGTINPGDQLPTVRQMAVDLKINLNTVRKVYHELEDEGYISTRQGKGTFVMGIPERHATDINKQKIMEELLENALIQGYALGFNSSEIIDILKAKIK